MSEIEISFCLCVSPSVNCVVVFWPFFYCVDYLFLIDVLEFFFFFLNILDKSPLLVIYVANLPSFFGLCCSDS